MSAAVTVAAVSGSEAVADQTSEVPDCPLARPTSFQVSPLPVTVADWAPGEGPSEDTKARRSSFDFVVLNAGVVTFVALLFADAVVSITGTDGTAGTTDADIADAGPVPTALVAVTVNV